MNTNVETLFTPQEQVYDSIVDLIPGPNNPHPWCASVNASIRRPISTCS